MIKLAYISDYVELRNSISQSDQYKSFVDSITSHFNPFSDACWKKGGSQECTNVNKLATLTGFGLCSSASVYAADIQGSRRQVVTPKNTFQQIQITLICLDGVLTKLTKR